MNISKVQRKREEFSGFDSFPIKEGRIAGEYHDVVSSIEALVIGLNMQYEKIIAWELLLVLRNLSRKVKANYQMPFASKLFFWACHVVPEVFLISKVVHPEVRVKITASEISHNSLVELLVSSQVYLHIQLCEELLQT